MNSTESIISITRSWIQCFVIAHNLCPFAKKPFDEGLIQFGVSNQNHLEELASEFIVFLQKISRIDSKEVSNAFFIIENKEMAFLDYLNYFDLANSVLDDLHLSEIFQLVSFHPKYQFSGTDYSDASNHANRSPYPMIHILRVDEVEKAIKSGEEVGLILKRNSETLEKLFGQ